jgi:lipoprotein signal peptidase
MDRYSTLRWGSLFVGAGLGIILGGIFYRVLRNSNMHSEYEIFMIASIALCTGIALIIVHIIERKAHKEEKKE